jgi:signal transduction histidine kinase
MGLADRACPTDPEDGELPWSERIPQAIGLFAFCVAIVVAFERHEFTRPNLGLLAIGVVVVPWILDIFGEPVAFMRQRRFELPMLAAWAVLVLAGIGWLVAGYPVSNDFAPFLVILLVGEMTATGGPRFGGVVCLASIGLLIAYCLTADEHGMYIWAFAFAVGWMGGAAFRRQEEIHLELTQAQTRLAVQAVEEERHRLARDIHDLIAHSLAVTMLQLSGARLALKAGDTNEALEALQDAETAGRSAMAEIHRTVGLLGSAGADTSPFPTPCAADVPGLVADFRRAGLQVAFALHGDLDAVPMATGLASYRMVQESLSNAVKHAPGAPVTLDVSVGEQEITINVSNPAPAGVTAGSTSGNGLRGMAERAELLGGVASAGNGDGTWKVDARLPLEDQPA